MVSWRDIGRGLYRRFLPAVALADLILSLPTWIITHATPSMLAVVVSFGALSLGYVSVLGALRTRLRSDAAIDGRRSVVAGVASLGLIVAGAATFRLVTPSLLDGIARHGALYFGSGALVALGMYFPWITARPTSIPTPDSRAGLPSPMASNFPAHASAPHPRDRERAS